ncbi:sushi, von Willebrand factor type A, EGF and pentraxin domain-containing protein 1-like [Macrosteles quadrilineatus]|uniref:sushi, von Willebrand factor type A, EGF and pentraxin domain-containing protein 1-like n=1 Tax=Macrosteles quadrilineatus TaxID=74068 RepID=UPI0023E11EB1|nr:sushi, von Willebrand factor type A, EGF and pentraxin domain-containing protein 1-like [Macrosteles quadrilineatus]
MALCLVFLIVLITRIHAQDVLCGHPAVPVNAKVTLSSTTLVPGTTATYSCDVGYEFFGNEISRCNDKGKWEGELPFCATNVGLRRPANQSTTVRGGSAGNANDGDLATVHDGRRCSETMREASPWWSVDLLRPYPVSAVRITTRGCCGQQPLQDLEIRVGNSSSDLQRNPLCAWYPGTLEEGITKVFQCARTLIGQHVFIQLVGVEGSLSMCEVEVFSTDEFSNDRCAPAGVGQDVELVAFDRTCYEFNVGRGSSFEDARTQCRKHGGDLAHGLQGVHNIFLLAELERRKSSLKTQLVWIGAQKEPSFTSHTWKWVDGAVVTKPAWGKDQPNNYNGEQNCVVLDGGRNWLWNDVGCNLDYLHWICQYTPVSCGSPDKQLNTTIKGTDYTTGKTISYVCPEGHMLVGNANRTCQQTGFWAGMAPSCRYVDCGSLDAPENGAVTLVNKRTTHGAEATYNCSTNYTLAGDSKRTCGDNGTWTGATPQCLFDWCPEPPRGEGVMVSVSGKRVGSVATYTCQPGFILFGQRELTCGPGGEWSGKAPSCKFVDCREPPNVDNGQYRLLNGTTTHGSVVEYSCDADHWLEPPERARLTCMRDAKWSADPPSCELVTCPEPEVPDDGFVVGYDFNIHSTIEYHCEPGHLLQGKNSLECTAQGEWNDEPPTCQFIDCGKVQPLPYGNVEYINGTTYLNSELSYSCVRNYRLVGQSRRRCLTTKQWSESSPRCEEIRCPEPKLAAHAILSVTNNDRMYGRTLIRTADSAVSVATYKIGALVKYRCERGYKIVGDPLSTCEETGHWSGNIPECVFVDCGMPTPPPHGRFSLASNVTYYGAAVLYECEDNYELDGFARRICLENGTWSSETPSCKEILCAEPEVDGVVTVRTSTHSIGGVAHYSCPRGTTMEGNSTRICLQRGSWSGRVPECNYVDCGEPGGIENGRVIVVNQTTIFNSVVEYHCVPQYQRIGPYLRKCLEDGRWSGEEPRCEMVSSAPSEGQNLGLAIGIGSGFIVFLLVILGLIYLRLRKERPVKNTENVEGAVRKEEQNAAVMSYATLSNNTTNHHNNIYDNIHDNEEMYDSPYEQTSHYEPSPISRRSSKATVTINGVAVN